MLSQWRQAVLGAAIVGSIVSMTAWSGGASAQPPLRYLAKPGVTAAQYQVDESRCVDRALRQAARGVSKAELLQQALALTKPCMFAKGYRDVVATPEQNDIYFRLNRKQRSQASGILAAGGDIRRLRPRQ